MIEDRRPLFSLTRKDFRIDYFRAGGKGGQKQNKTSSGCRITHIETGISAEARDTRSQEQNRKAAFMRLYHKPAFQVWMKMRQAEAILSRQEVERMVDKMMEEKNIKTEYYTPKGQ